MMNRGTNKTKASQTALAASLIISNNMKTLNDATIPLRVPSHLKDALQILAEKSDRSLSNFIKLELEKVVAAMSAPAPAPVVATYTSKPKAKTKAKTKAKPKAKAKK